MRPQNSLNKKSPQNSLCYRLHLLFCKLIHRWCCFLSFWGEVLRTGKSLNHFTKWNSEFYSERFCFCICITDYLFTFFNSETIIVPLSLEMCLPPPMWKIIYWDYIIYQKDSIPRYEQVSLT